VVSEFGTISGDLVSFEVSGGSVGTGADSCDGKCEVVGG